jgi:hypothetical protein
MDVNFFLFKIDDARRITFDGNGSIHRCQQIVDSRKNFSRKFSALNQVNVHFSRYEATAEMVRFGSF